jgi:hypothetical protein
MKRIICLFLLFFLSVGILAGCVESGISESKENLFQGDGFPQCLVGVWQSNKFGWAFKFEPDGTIRKFRHMLAREVDMVADRGVIDMKGPDEGTYALFVIGLCETDYEPRTRTLDVKVFLDHYQMQLPNVLLEGGSKDYFTGQVSEDCKTWNVKWRIDSWLEGADPPDPNLMKANIEPLVFTKLDITDKK